ncbi:TPA: hypothetical protein ACWLUJ_005726 [Pseudomonas aeruginosa]|nr:hypothetical protein [Pseudomonas aeruginosa]
MTTKKISDLSVAEWLQKLQAGFGDSVEITLRPDGSGIIRRGGGEKDSYFHTPPDALHWLGNPDTDVPI